MTLTSFKSWLQQPSTITGLGVAAGTICGIVAKVLTHDDTLAIGISGSVLALVHVAIPDNSAAESSIDKFVKDVIAAQQAKQLAAAIPLLTTDALATLQALTAPAAVTVTTTKTTTQQDPARDAAAVQSAIAAASQAAQNAQPAAPVAAA